MVPSSLARSRCRRWALSGSFQKFGSALSASISPSCFFLAGRSKITSQRVEAPLQVLDLVLAVIQTHRGGVLSRPERGSKALSLTGRSPRSKTWRMDVRHAVYAGTFDPVTLGHTSIIERASRLYERVTVAIGVNPAKTTLFSSEERLQLLRKSLAGLSNVTVETFEGLLIQFCQRIGAGVIVRGMRLLTDFEYEFQLGLANRDLAPDVETVYLFTESEHVYVSSSLVKEIAANGGDASRYVPAAVWQALRARLQAGSG